MQPSKIPESLPEGSNEPRYDNDCRLLHDPKAESPMDVTFDGITIDVKLLQSSKVYDSIAFTFD